MKQIQTEDATGSNGQQSSGIYPVPNATKSYWRSELHAIDSHRTTSDLPSECSTAIIGSGMSGAALAYHLTKSHPPNSGPPPSIVMLEARELCSGATGRNGGHVKTKTDTMLKIVKRDGLDAASEVRDLTQRQIYAIKDVVEREGLECEFELRRSYDAYLGAEEAEARREEFEACLKDGQAWTREVDWVGPQFAEQVTSIKGAKGAFSSPACSLWPYKFVTQLLSKSINSGSLNLQTHTPVTHITTCPSTGTNLLHTARGTIRAEKLIFATNGYTGGLSPIYAGKITPLKGTCTHLVPSGGPVAPHLSHTYNIAYAPKQVDYLNPRPDGGIVVGGGSWTFSHDKDSYYNNWDDSTLFPNARSHFDGLMQRHFRGWEGSGCELESIWTGIMGGTGDEWPHVGEVPGSGREGRGKQWIMAGFNGGGMAMIWLTAEGVARMIAKGESFKQTALPRVFETTTGRLGMSN